MNQKKHERAASIIEHLAALFLSKESNGTSLITVTGISLSDKEDRAKILISVFPDDKEAEALEFVKRKRSEFREYVRDNSKIARLPMFDFEIDAGEKNRQRVEEVMNND